MMKRLAAYCLLIAFGVLLTPREFLHECDNHLNPHESELFAKDHSEHQNDTNHSDHYPNSHLEKKCFACEYEMTAALEPIAFQFRFEKSVYPISQQVQNHLVELRYVETDCLRGPPIV